MSGADDDFDSEAPADPGFIYFIGCLATQSVKIGYTKGNPLARLATLQTGNANKLTLLLYVDGSVPEERELHRMYAADRLHGEWFALSDSVIDAMAQYRQGYGMKPSEVGYGYPRS